MALIRQTGVFTDRFGNTVDLDNIPAAEITAASNYIGSTSQFVEVDDVRSLSGSDVVYIVGRTIRITSNGALRQNSNGQSETGLGGKHIYFINCDLEFENVTAAGVLGPDVNGTTARSFTGRVSDGQANSTSVNVVGCDIYFANASVTIQTVVTDVIDSNFRISNEISANNYVLNRNPGSITNNALFEGRAANRIYEWNFYGTPQDLNNFVIDGFRLKTGSGGGDGFVYAPSARFSNTNPSWFYAFGPDQPNNGFTHTGFTYIAPAAAATALTSKFSSPNANTVLINSYGYNPTVYADGLLTETVRGCRYRFRTNAGITERSGTNTAGAVTSSARSQDITNELLTNTAGKLASNRRSLDGQSTFVPGYFDYGQFEVNDTVGATSILSTQTGQTSEEGLVSVPIQVFKSTSGFATTNRVEGRSYTNDLDYADTPSESDYTVNEYIPIDAPNVVAPSLVGTRIKTANVNADNTHNFDSFTADTPVSLNDIANAVRAGWAQYYVDVDPTKQTGDFDETTYPIRLHIRQAPETGGNLWQEDEFGMKVAGFGGGGQFRVAVLGNGLANADDDLFDVLPGVRSLNFDGLPLSDVTLTAQERLVNMGNVTNAILTAGDDTGGDPETSSLRYDLFFNDANVEIRGTTTLTSGVNRPLTEADINLPTVVGTTYVDADSGETIQPNITIARGTLIQSIGTEGLLDNSVWNNVSTMTDVVADNVRNWTLNGGTHQMTITNVPAPNASDSYTWNITNQVADGLNINLPTGAPTGLVTINTDNQLGEEDNWNEVRRWLLAELGGTSVDDINGVNQARLDQTAPTSGYYLPHPPLAAPVPYQWVLNDVGVLDSGYWIIKNTDDDSIYNQTTIVNGVVTTPPTQVFNTTNTNYRSYLMLTSAIGGATYKCSIQDFTSANVAFANFTADLQVRPDLVNAFFTQASSQLQEGDGGNDIVAEVLAHTPGTDKLTLQWSNADGIRATETGTQAGVIQAFTTVQGVQRYVTYLAEFNRLFDLIDYQPSAMAINNSAEGVTGVSQTEGVFFNSVSQATQQKGTSASGFNSDPTVFTVPSGAGSGDTFPSATNNQFQSNTSSTLSVPNTVNAIASTLAGSGSATVGDLNELGNELKSNQGKLSTDVRLASQLRPASGTIPNTAD